MIKLCKILNFNKITGVVVAKYDNIQIQFVTDKDILSSTIYVKKTASGYEIVSKDEYLKSLKIPKKNNKTDFADSTSDISKETIILST